MIPEDITQRDYQFLLVDLAKENEGVESEDQNSQCTIFLDRDLEVQRKFGEIFGRSRLSDSASMGVPIWNYQGSQVVYTTSVDRTNPNKPKYFGRLTIFGSISEVEKIDDLLETKLPKIVGR